MVASLLVDVMRVRNAMHDRIEVTSFQFDATYYAIGKLINSNNIRHNRYGRYVDIDFCRDLYLVRKCLFIIYKYGMIRLYFINFMCWFDIGYGYL